MMFHLDGQTNVFTHTMAITNLAGAALALINNTSNRLYTSVLIEARPPANQQPRQDQGFALQRSYGGSTTKTTRRPAKPAGG